ncbi:hypothetical protein [Amycolatopsis sp. NPDC051371]|uniref:TRADD-N-associated membrane domain-containing protein n=1 Tax=Amycolatopsis sp. NPDC051371 TaxID=3155800 RepID=UPI00341667A4
MVKLEELRAATDFVLSSGEMISVRVTLRAANGSSLAAAQLGELVSGGEKLLLRAARQQFKDVRSGTLELDAKSVVITARLYAYGRLNLGRFSRLTVGTRFEMKVLALLKVFIPALKHRGERLLDQPLRVTAGWSPGRDLEVEKTDPVLSSDSAAIDHRVRRMDTRRHRLRWLSAATILVAVLCIVGGGFVFTLTGSARVFALTVLCGAVLLAYGAWGRAKALSLFQDIAAIRDQQEIVESLQDKELEPRAMKLFQVHSQQLKRYYDQALRQRGLIFLTGIFCIVAGFSVIAVAFVLLRTMDPAGALEKILVAALGAIGGILGNFIAVVYLRMFTETVKSIGTFHDRLVATHHLYFANFLVSKVADDQGRDSAFRLIAEIAARQERGGATPTAR